MMRKPTQAQVPIGAVTFAQSVQGAFAFLIKAGFEVVEKAPTRVSFRRGALDCNIYLGRHSHELGFQCGIGEDRYSMSEILRVADPSIAKEYRNAVVTDASALSTAVLRLARLVKLYCAPALEDERRFLDMLRDQRRTWSKEYALDVLAEQVRPKAEAAFRRGEYGEAFELYKKITSRLTASERKKLEIARKRR